MRFKKKEMINILREEYEKRVDYYINLSEIEVKDKSDNDLISSAKGLKVKDKAGFMYTVLDIVQSDGKVFVKLLKPGEALSTIDDPVSSTPMNEFEEKDKEESRGKSNKAKLDGDVLPRNKDAEFKRNFKSSISAKSAVDTYSSEGESLLVPIEEFEDNFTL